MRVLLTGATGHLGRHIMFEYILQYWDRLGDLELILLGRGNDKTSFEQRIRSILLHDGLDYLGAYGARWRSRIRLATFLRRNVQFVECHLDAPEMQISPKDRRKLLSLKINQVYHIAAVTDFRDTVGVRQKLSLNILQGTSRILELAGSLNIDAFNYVSTAYVCGKTFGQVEAEPVRKKREFRNPYERLKTQAEALLQYFEYQTGITCRVFRPSTICGRMIEGTMGTTSKFDVFYGWASFFVREKMREGSKQGNAPVRIHCNPRAGLNIVPVDYCAKLMLAICRDDTLGGVFHLAHDREVPHDQWIAQIMAQLGIRKYQLSESEPVNKSELELRYYRTVGKLFKGYLTSESLQFDMSNSRHVRTLAALDCPVLDEKGFANLLSFAGNNNYGVPVANDLQRNVGNMFGLLHPGIQRLAYWMMPKKRQTLRSIFSTK